MPQINQGKNNMIGNTSHNLNENGLLNSTNQN